MHFSVLRSSAKPFFASSASARRTEFVRMAICPFVPTSECFITSTPLLAKNDAGISQMLKPKAARNVLHSASDSSAFAAFTPTWPSVKPRTMARAALQRSVTASKLRAAISPAVQS